MDRKTFKIKRNTAVPVGIDGLLASFSSTATFSVTLTFAILVHWLFPIVSVLMVMELL